MAVRGRFPALFPALFLAAMLALPAALMGESAGAVPPGNPAPADSSRQVSKTLAQPAKADTASRPKSRADTVLVVKHEFHHREQIITGSVVMTCLALMMVVMNNYNPR